MLELIGIVWLMIKAGFVGFGLLIILCMFLSAIQAFFYLLGRILKLGGDNEK
ncbi:hypothetical protein [Escherichia phage EC_OE_11]|nr:hypothetical protein [Escherichia phage EC_OE_11]